MNILYPDNLSTHYPSSRNCLEKSWKCRPRRDFRDNYNDKNNSWIWLAAIHVPIPHYNTHKTLLLSPLMKNMCVREGKQPVKITQLITSKASSGAQKAM